MGRAVYSSAYTTSVPAVAVRTEPEPNVDIAVERWSSWNHFDPDSDEFFQDAEFEAFISPDELRAQQSEATPLITDRIAEMSDSSDSSDQESDTADGSENQSGGSSPTEWNSQDARSARETETLASNRRTTIMEVSDGVVYTIHAPSATETLISNAVDAVLPTAGSEVETVSAHLIGRSPSPEFAMPSTPPPQQTFPIFRRQVTPNRLFTPSPPTSVPPRFYSWPAPATPASPSFLPVTRDGPLPNARARMSYTRIDTTPVRVRITNPVM
ncbi:hypothetical protein D9619_006258 [Psilocybe cf. subviscida]|uniref:Uncharacterized protein n=1 Tax=Psilocybe cf. subviscida TaxID=2480587 RepID=A0A8H5EXU8_9AGAR|nr:hypothetical protein D9619_006258 [Psilocybe cf. subviscida]